MIFKDYYAILALNTNKIDIEAIKVAYRDMAKKYHPDLNLGNSRAEERFKDVNEAYQVLTDSSKKRKYDRIWTSHIGRKKKKFNAQYDEADKKEDVEFSNFFNMFFGDVGATSSRPQGKKSKKIPIKGDNIETEIKVSLQDAFFGKEKKISLRTVEGNMKTFLVRVPAGIRNNEKIRLTGLGKPGINGASCGDMFIKISIENDKKYRLDGSDMITDLCLTPWEAALGTRAWVNCIDGSTSVFVPPGIGSSEKIRIPGKGYKNGTGGRGDLVAEVKIMVPKELSEEEKNLYEQLGKASNFMPRQNYDAFT